MIHAPPPSSQRGVITLGISMVILVLVSLIVFHTSSNILLEIKTSNNQYYQTKALEAARGGAEYGISWLMTNSASSWTTDSSGPSGNNQKATVSMTNPQTIGGYSVDITIWRNSASPAIMEVRAIASNADATATVRQKFYANTISFNSTVIPPIVINGCLSGVTGGPDTLPDTPGQTMVVSSQSSACLDNGHLDLNGGTMQGSGFTGTAWNYVFSTSKADMKALAAVSSSDDIRFYDASNPFPDVNWHDNLGTEAAPGILIFDTGSGCPKINGSPVIWGIVYYSPECGADHGWGGAVIHGSVISEGSITSLNANTQFYPWSGATTNSNYTVSILAKVVASWRDF